MNREQAVKYLSFSGFSDEQIKVIEGAFTCETCEDAISKEAVFEQIGGWIASGEYEFTNATDYLSKRIKALPPVTPQPKTGWIPVSERLPEDRNWHLGIFKEADTGWINPLPFICDYVGHETKATTKEHWILRGFTDRDEHIDYYFNLECVAWMPFLEPYKAEGSKE